MVGCQEVSKHTNIDDFFLRQGFDLGCMGSDIKSSILGDLRRPIVLTCLQKM
jgi:hypothetical protein